jgi:hypothetical protein
MEPELIQAAARQGPLFFTEHAVRQMARRRVTVAEVQEAILAGSIIEDYPDDKYARAVGSTAIRGRAGRWTSSAQHHRACE